MRKSILVLFVVIGSIASVRSQTVMIPGAWPGWGLCYPPPPALDAMHLLYDPAGPVNCQIQDAAMRITWGTMWTDPIFAQLAVVDTNHLYPTGASGRWFSAIAPNRSSVLRSSWGDLVLSATTALPPPTWGGTFDASIRFGTTPNDSAIDAEHPKDFERMTLWYDGKLGVGTHGVRPTFIFADSGHAGEYDLLHLHVPCIPATYNVDESQGYAINQLSALKLSYGVVQDAQLRFAEFGFDRGHQFTSFGNDEDLVLALNTDTTVANVPGDLILTNRRMGRALRFGTTSVYDNYPGKTLDRERMTVADNGNVGIDVPPDAVTGLAKPLDQLQIGGGLTPYPGNSYATPGLTIYGGSPLENTSRPGGGLYPGDWRYISFNHYEDHSDPSARHSYRMQPIGSSEIDFSENGGGMLHLTAVPFDTTMPHDTAMRDFSGAMSMSLTGEGGLFVWSDESLKGGLVYHHLVDLFRPGVTAWPVTRNTNGLFIHHTPVLITSDSSTTPSIDFTHLANVHPDLGDGDTWVLAVNGPALFKEVFVNTNDWPDYVFLPEYKLRSIDDFDAYIRLNHHLPEIASATQMNGARSLGQTQQQLTKQVEEMALYVVELNKELKELKEQVRQLKAREGGK